MATDEATQNKVCEYGDRFKRGEEVTEDDCIPPIWTIGFDMTIWVEAVMHLLEHGIIPAIIEILEAVFLDHKMGKAFERFANSHLDDIPHLRIDWSKVKRVPRANWLAEDGFGYCRIMFFYGDFSSCKIGADTNIFSA